VSCGPWRWLISPITYFSAGNPEDDSFHEVRKIQAAAAEYPTPEAYYDALNDAIARWRNNRQGSAPHHPPSWWYLQRQTVNEVQRQAVNEVHRQAVHRQAVQRQAVNEVG